jgi:hypothetical protein
MTEQKKLRELANNVRIVGTLKEVDLQVKPNKNDASVMQIMGSITVTTVDKKNNQINEHKVNLFAKHTSKLYKGYVTIMNDFKSSSVVGSDAADRVQVTGSIDENLYMGNGELKAFNRIRGLFVNRIDEQALTKNPGLANDEAVAQLELLVKSVEPKTDREGVETDEMVVKAFSVGYNNGVHEIRDIIVGPELADVISENYEPNSTGLLTLKINNYAEIEETEEDPFASQGEGFGVQVDIEGPVTRYTRELRVIGGFPPYLDGRELSEDDIALAKQIHALKVQDVKSSVPDTPPTQTGANGFGSNASSTNADPFATGGGIDISDDDLPF